MALQGSAIVVGLHSAERKGRLRAGERSCDPLRSGALRSPGNHRTLCMGTIVAPRCEVQCIAEAV